MRTSRALALGAALALAAGPSGAAGAPARPAPKEAELGQKRSVAPDAALGGTLEAKKPQAPAGGPALDLEAFRKTVEVDISGKRREEIASLQKLIQLGGGSDAETPQWYFRLAELLWEESQYFFFEANRRDDRIIALGKGSPQEVSRLQAEKRELEAQMRRHQDQAVALYKAIVARHPQYPRLDEVLFFLGQNLAKRDRNDPESLKAYRALIQRYPGSRYVPDAWMAFGEYYFEKGNSADRVGNLRRALEAYRKAAENQESAVYGYALYKQAWVHYNLASWAEALELFRAVIFFGELPTSTIPQERKLALVKEARKDYVRTYSHVGSAEAAFEDFRRVGGEHGSWDMLKSLAGIYFDEGKDRDAVLLHARLIRERPLSFEAPLFQSRIVTSAGRMGRKDAAVAQAHQFVKMLRDLEARPDAGEEKNQRLLADARKTAEQTLRVLAVQYHNEWRKTRDEPVAGHAAAVYHDYLTLFPDAAPAYDMRFFHAELLYALGDFARAGEEYERVSLLDVEAAKAAAAPGAEARKPGRFFRDALENAVFAYDVVAKKLDETEKRAPADPKQRLPLAPARQKLVDACQRYLEWQPKGDRWVEIAYKAANIHYRHNAFGEATDLFTRIALDHPGHELAGYATNLVLDAYNLLGDWRNVNGWAKRFYANGPLLAKHPQLKDDLARIIEQSAFKVIEERERARDFEGAADEYLAFAREWPGSRHASTALHNASVAYARAHRLDRAMEIRELFLQRHPADPLAPQALYDNAEAYEAIGDFADAAERYERYFREWRRATAPKAGAPARRGAAAAPAAAAPGPTYDERKANDAIVNAAVFRAGLRDWARAEAATLAYLEAWPAGADAARLSLGLADLYGRQGQVSKELKALEDYQRRFAKDPDEWLAIQHRIALLFEKQGNGAMARQAYAIGLDHYKRNRDRVKERGLALVAHAMYLDLEPAFAEYDKISLNVAPKFLKGQLEIKGKRLKQLEAAYGQVVLLKQAEPAICALHRIGLAYRRFAQALHAAPVPKELRGNPEWVAEYKAQVAQLTEPLDAKAVEGLELAMNASRDYGVVNACARDATAILLKYKPDVYGPSPEVVPEIARAKVPDAPAGYGLLAEIQAAPAAPRAAARGGGDAGALPPLRVRPTSGTVPDAAEPRDPQGRVPKPEPRLPRKKGSSIDDEDLLP